MTLKRTEWASRYFLLLSVVKLSEMQLSRRCTVTDEVQVMPMEQNEVVTVLGHRRLYFCIAL